MLDEHQRAVVGHPGGPLLVLAGPGTGKTTTIVESVVDRIERRGTDPERVLILTFGRKAAGELRRRVTARLRRTTRTPVAMTFHSYAYALLRREAVLSGGPPPRLLTGPEQLLEVRRLLHGELEDGALDWPEDLREPLKTRGFAEELRDFLSRAAERGLDGVRIQELGRRHGRPDWVAVGRFADRYETRFDLDPEPTLDYAELIAEAARLLSNPAVQARERAALDAVFVDEYQDTDPAQEYLLHQLAGDGRDLVAVGDPDQSIYGFRGADVHNILKFPERFRTLDGHDAPIVALRLSRRAGTDLLTASRRIASRLPAAPLPTPPPTPHPTAPGPPAPVLPASEPAGAHAAVSEPSAPGRADSDSRRVQPAASEPAVKAVTGGRGHRDLVASPDAPPGEVRVLLADSTSQEAAVVADTLRRAHLVEGVPWHRMAVVVRSAKRQVPLLRRALVNAGVPTMIAGDEVPIAQEPGVRPLLTMLKVALDPAALDENTAEELLTGPLGGTDMIGVRRLRRALKIADNEVAADPPELPYVPRSSGELLVAAIEDPRELVRIEPHVAAPAERVAKLLATARSALGEGASAEEVLWAVWQASGLATRWADMSLSGGTRGAQADRDLDAVVALFDQAARFVDRMPKAGPEVFLDDLASQEIPGDTLAERAPDGDAVRVLTAHRAKGLEWDVVVVTGVQEGVWPDLRLRGTLLGVEDLVEVVEGGRPNAASLASKLLAEERRLFYVAVTRARRRLVVTAVGGEDTDERPSRFLSELMPGAIEEAGAGDRARWLSMPALVADLRSAVTDPTRPERMRKAAARQLARLAAAGVPGAHPNEWYALTPISDDRPLSWPEGVVTISPSAVESFTKCGLRWLLETAVGAAGTSTAQGLGNVIHALAVLAATGVPDENQLGKRLDDVWKELDFGGVWFNRKQRQVAEQMIGRFLRWQEENDRDLVALEESFVATIAEGVQIKGRVDRLESDENGRAVIIDLKTGGSKPKPGELDRHPQLGVYQLAALLGAFARHGLTEPGGAALVQLGKAAGKHAAIEQKQDALADDQNPGWAADLVDTVAIGMSGPLFQAKVNDGCRTCAARASCPVNDSGGQVC